MKKATFEVATLADAVNKASRVAPTKGASFDRAAGVVLEIDPGADEQVVIKSTDLELSFRQQVNVLDLGDEACTWRVSSSLFNSILSTLPMSSGSTVTVAEKDDGDGYIYFKSGKTKAKLRFVVGDFPIIPLIDPETLSPAAGFARRMQQVAWACDKNRQSVLGGIHIDGNYLYACDRQSAARVPCVVPVQEPVTAPLAELSALIKNTSHVNVRAIDGKILLMPDPYTQMSSLLYADPYPKIDALFSREQYTNTVVVESSKLQSALDRMLILVKSERMPVTTIEIGDGVMRLEMEVPEVGKIDDEVEAEGGSPGDPFVLSFTPTCLTDALNASGRPKVSIDYGPTALSQMRLRDDNDFVAVIMPRKV